jgi:hypothetical protein
MNSDNRTYKLAVPVSLVILFVVLALMSMSSSVWAADVTIDPTKAATLTSTGETAANVSVSVPVGTFASTTQLTVNDVTTSALEASLVNAPLPSNIQELRKPFEVKASDANGALLSSPTLTQCITITATYDADDVTAAAGSPSNLRLVRLDSRLNVWIPLTTQLLQHLGTIQAQVCSTLSTFGVGVSLPPGVEPTPTAPPPTPVPTATPVPPAPGDFSPSSSLLSLLLVAGLGLVIAGAFYIGLGRKELET